ncbi:MAG: polyprenyl synthetase family protein, partial [Candidatus Bipolaricaulota bacterium]
AALEMTRGQANQTINKGHLKLSFDDYLKRIRQKTALLIGKSCLLGAKASGAGAEEQSRMEKYGVNLGISFQITDDVKDLIGSREELGKDPGNDLKEGTLTLPIMVALEKTSRDDFFRTVLKKENPGKEEIRRGIEVVKSSGAVKESLNYSRKFAEEANSALPDHSEGLKAVTALRVAARYFGGEEINGKSYIGQEQPV